MINKVLLEDIFDEHLPETPFVGVIGLDGAKEHRGNWSEQVDVFEYILKRCRSAGGKILSVHSRPTPGAVLDRLEQFEDAGVAVLYWFSGPLES